MKRKMNIRIADYCGLVKVPPGSLMLACQTDAGDRSSTITSAALTGAMGQRIYCQIMVIYTAWLK